MISLTDTLQDWTAERLIDEYGDELLRLCLFYMGDRQLAEDAFQETMVKAWRALENFRGESGMKTWLFHIAVNTCRDMLRSGWFRMRKRVCRWMSCRNWSSRRTSMRGRLPPPC